MTFDIAKRLGAFALAIAVLGAPQGAAAAPNDDLKQAQSDAFAAMLASPADINAMLAYAQASVKLRDYEAAVSTLERLLDIRPGSKEARFELAVAYHALGAYEIAQYHLNILETQGELTEQQSRSLNGFAKNASARSADETWKGYAAAGLSYAPNGANWGGNAQFGLRWRQDLGGPNSTYWQTDLRGALYGFRDGAGLDVGRVMLRTGPRIALDGTAYGPKIRPYLEINGTWDADDQDSATLGLGMEYANTYSAQWSSFFDVEIGRSFGLDTGTDDGRYVSAVGGVTWRPSRDTRLRLSLLGQQMWAETATSDRLSLGARVDLSHEFTNPLRSSDRKWRASLYAQTQRVDYANDPSNREDQILSAGLRLRAYLKDDFFVQASLNSSRRDSSDDTLDTYTPVYGLLFGLEF